jgi:VTC domain
MPSVDATLRELRPISLADLDARAALLRRVDVKYVITRARLEKLITALADDHDVLAIHDRRTFAYATVYFDTPSLRCFTEHGADVAPRFKARTRHYVDSGLCMFEVKVKRADGETDKHQREHRADAGELDDAAREHLAAVLREAGIAPPDRLGPVLRTAFDRITLAHRAGTARVTIDLDVRLTGPGGDAVQLRGDLALVESKSEDGDAPADHVLRRLEARRASLSKYRTGIDAHVRRDATGDLSGIRELFEPVA